MTEQKRLKVTIRTTDDLVFSGEVDRMTSYNEVGKFDVYPMHANFISIIERQLTLYQKHVVVKDIQLDRAVMKVKQDIINIYLGIEALFIGEEEMAEIEKHQATNKTPTQLPLKVLQK